MHSIRRSIVETLPVSATAALACAIAIAVVLGACATSPESGQAVSPAASPTSGPASASRSGAAGQGQLQPEEIHGTILARMFEFEKCHSDFVRGNPDLASRQFDIKVNFVVNPDGQVTQAAVEPAVPRSPTLNACVIKVMKTLQFPRPNPSGEVRVKYPLWFNRN